MRIFFFYKFFMSTFQVSNGSLILLLLGILFEYNIFYFILKT